MSISFFGKGIGALRWTVVADASPKAMVGMNGALIFVSLIAFCVIISYGPIVGEIKRLDLAGPEGVTAD